VQRKHLTILEPLFECLVSAIRESNIIKLNVEFKSVLYNITILRV